MGKRISLEPEAVEVCNANATPPFLFQLPPWKGREVLEQVQSTPIAMYPANVSSVIVDTGRWGEIRVCVVGKCYLLYSWCGMGVRKFSYA